MSWAYGDTVTRSGSGLGKPYCVGLVKVSLWGMPRPDSYDSKGFVYVFSFLRLLEMVQGVTPSHPDYSRTHTMETNVFDIDANFLGDLGSGEVLATRFHHRLVLVLEGDVTPLDDSGGEL